MKRWYWIIDVAKCENCNNCYLSCKDEYVGNEWEGYAAPQPPHQQKWIEIYTNERGQHPLIDVGYLPRPCQHCDNAPCIKAATNGAIYKRQDGIVIIDPVKAKGQKKVIEACPYGAISWNEENSLPQKCTYCAHLLDAGWKQTRCMQSCPTGALTVRHIEDAKMQKIIKEEKLEVYRPELKTSPTVYYKNLYRFTKCFIAGSIAVRKNGKEECAEGAVVTLLKGSEERICYCFADTYGDFKFDNLEENSGKYTVHITLEGYDVKTVEAELKKSLNIGVIFLQNSDSAIS
jgi:Fe-S-cluster-containing dehydrogenase component